MNHKETIHELIKKISIEVFEFIQEQEKSDADRWVRAADIENILELQFPAVPKSNIQHGSKGWLFAIIARMLEDLGKLEYKKDNNRAFYRSKRNI